MQAEARAVRARYAMWEAERYGRAWTPEEIALGFVGDVGDLAKLVQGKAGVRPRDDLDGVDLEGAFTATMRALRDHLEVPR